MKLKVEFHDESQVLDTCFCSSKSGTNDYNKLKHKPSINGVELTGDMSSEELNIVTSYEELPDKPSINGVELVGNKTSGDLNIASFPDGGYIGDVMMKTGTTRDAVGWVTPASSAEEDNTRPITAAAVYTEIGNINALLATI